MNRARIFSRTLPPFLLLLVFLSEVVSAQLQRPGEVGTVVTWGTGLFGENTVPENLMGVVAVATGWEHTLVLKNDGTVERGGGTIMVKAVFQKI